ncbi:MAG: hypothetical protein ACAI44_02825 [Candidatus Sericytochromatia bacterium]
MRSQAMIRRVLVAGLLLTGLAGCENFETPWDQAAKQLDKLQRENRKLQQENVDLKEKLSQAEAEGVMNKVVVALYDLRHALEKYAQQNEGKYPVADNITDMQARLKSYLPDNFELDPTHLERMRSQPKGYIMIANVKGREIVVSNLL